jgi:hypothetical protein
MCKRCPVCLLFSCLFCFLLPAPPPPPATCQTQDLEDARLLAHYWAVSPALLFSSLRVSVIGPSIFIAALLHITVQHTAIIPCLLLWCLCSALLISFSYLVLLIHSSLHDAPSLYCSCYSLVFVFGGTGTWIQSIMLARHSTTWATLTVSSFKFFLVIFWCSSLELNIFLFFFFFGITCVSFLPELLLFYILFS